MTDRHYLDQTSAHTPDVDTLEAAVRTKAAMWATVAMQVAAGKRDAPDERAACGDFNAALSDLAAAARANSIQWPSGSTEVQFCLHERRCLELRAAEADRDAWRNSCLDAQDRLVVRREAQETAEDDRDRWTAEAADMAALARIEGERVAELEHQRSVACDWAAELADHKHRLSNRVAELRAALQLIATPRRPDGTYNRDRAACEHIARAALAGDRGGA